MVTHNKIGMSLGGDCPGTDACDGEFCDWIGNYKDCIEYKKGEVEKESEG